MRYEYFAIAKIVFLRTKSSEEMYVIVCERLRLKILFVHQEPK